MSHPTSPVSVTVGFTLWAHVSRSEIPDVSEPTDVRPAVRIEAQNRPALGAQQPACQRSHGRKGEDA
jgi:hypothetical protein